MVPLGNRLSTGMRPWLGSGAVAGAILLASRLGLGVPCPLLTLTGWQCPFCGGTRAAHALLSGDFEVAWNFNQLIAIAAPLAAVLMVVDLARCLRTTSYGLRQRRVTNVQWAVIAVLLVGFMVVRNLF